MKITMILLFLSILVLSCSASLESGPTQQQLDRFNTERVTEHSDLLLEESANSAEKGAIAPDFTIVSSDGTPLTRGSYTDEPVLLYFMATWCPFCDQDFKSLSTVIDEFPEANILVISLDVQENAEILENYKQQYPKLHGIPFAPGNIDILTKYKVKTTTTKYLIDANGVVQYSGSGAFKADQWRTLLGAMV